MPVLIGIPVLVLAVVIQTTAFSRLPLLFGTADLVLLVLLAWILNDKVKHGLEWVLMGGLMVSFVSALPFFTPLWGYFLAAGLSYWLKKRIWQTPVLAMLVSTFFGTLVILFISAIVLQISGSDISLTESFSLVILPSVLWNLILAIPVYTLIAELADWLYPQEVNI
jgi:biotin transporter BioY